jgi:hypothetical protein
MAEKGLQIIDNVILNEIGGKLDTINNQWLIPKQEI